LEANNKRKRRVVVALSIAGVYAVALIAFKSAGYSIMYNAGESFPNKIYLGRIKPPDLIERGMLVIFKKPMPNTPYENQIKNLKLFKMVACLPGDYLERVENRFVCNGVLIAEVRNVDSNGEPYAVSFDYDGLIPEGRYFVTAPHHHSFDSRYFGLIEKEAIKGEAICAIF
jgi:conjugative transfer signal peptidase TraF